MLDFSASGNGNGVGDPAVFHVLYPNDAGGNRPAGFSPGISIMRMTPVFLPACVAN